MHFIDKNVSPPNTFEWELFTYFTCGAVFGGAIAGMLIDVGMINSLTVFDFAVAIVSWYCISFSLFKQEDLKSSKLNSGNAFDDDESATL